MSRSLSATRQRILTAVWELMEAQQGKGVRMKDIALRAGISRQAVYLHFPSRAELLIATTRYIDEVKKVEARFEESRTAETGRERLDAFIHGWCNYIPRFSESPKPSWP